MKTFQYALAASLSAVALGATLFLTRPASAQETRPSSPVSADSTYSGTSVDGKLQEALDAAIAKAELAARYGPNGSTISDAMFNWQLLSVTGTRGGIQGKTDVTVRIQMTK